MQTATSLANDRKTTTMLARLEIGFRMDCEELLRASDNMERELQEAPNSVIWEEIREKLDTMREGLSDLHQYFATEDPRRISHYLSIWEKTGPLKSEISEEIRKQRRALDIATGGDAAGEAFGRIEAQWQIFCDMLHSTSGKLELLRGASTVESEAASREILKEGPRLTSSQVAGAQEYLTQYRSATHQLEKDRHDFKGAIDLVKGLMMWDDTPEEKISHDTATGQEAHPPVLPKE